MNWPSRLALAAANPAGASVTAGVLALAGLGAARLAALLRSLPRRARERGLRRREIRMLERAWRQ